MDIIVDTYGVSLGKKSERLVIREKGQLVCEKPFFDITQITILSSGVSISTDVIQECMEHGIQINLLSYNGQPYAQIASPHLTGTVITRREQILAYKDARGILIAKELLRGKIKNQINVLKYFSKYRKKNYREIYENITEGIKLMEGNLNEINGIAGSCIDDVRGQLLSIEGRGANTYWKLFKLLIGDRVDFKGREHQGASDPVNSLLNYGYGILYSKVWGAIILAGLEPFAGFMHVDRPGKPSLVLDLIEEFRQQVVDKVVIAMINKGTEIKLEDGTLAADTKKVLAEKILERLESDENYEGKKYKMKTIIQRQARHLATFIRGEGKYRAFIGGW